MKDAALALLLVALWFLVRRERRARVRLQAAQQRPATELEARVTERTEALQHALTSLNVSDGRLRAVFDATNDAILTLNKNQIIVLANPAAAKIFGYALDTLVGLPLDLLIPPRYRARHRDDVQTFGATEAHSRSMGRRAVVHALRSDGSEFPAEASISTLQIDGQRMYTVVLRDVTARQQAEAELLRTQAALASSHSDLQRLIESQGEVQETERKRIALELHDDLQQTMAAIQMDLAAAAELVETDAAKVPALLAETRELVAAAIVSTRRIINDLRPQILDDLGLVPALQALAAQFTQRTGVACNLDAPGAEDDAAPLSRATATGLFRVTQEALNNVAKHAGATQVTIELEPQGQRIALRVHDDGCGIAPGDQQKPGSFGVLGMQERLRALGGTLAVRPGSEGGTTVEATVPEAPALEYFLKRAPTWTAPTPSPCRRCNTRRLP